MNRSIEQRISWRWTFAYRYVFSAIVLGSAQVACVWWTWDSARSHHWVETAMGIVAVGLSCAAWRGVGRGVYDVWLRDDTIILRRGRRCTEVPLARVSSVEVGDRARLTRMVSLYWTDEAGVQRRARFAVTDSPNWTALLERLTNRVPHVPVVG